MLLEINAVAVVLSCNYMAYRKVYAVIPSMAFIQAQISMLMYPGYFQ